MRHHTACDPGQADGVAGLATAMYPASCMARTARKNSLLGGHDASSHPPGCLHLNNSTRHLTNLPRLDLKQCFDLVDFHIAQHLLSVPVILELFTIRLTSMTRNSPIKRNATLCYDMQAISNTYMIYLDNPHAVDLDSNLKYPYELSSTNTLIMMSMTLLIKPVRGSTTPNQTLLFFGLRDTNTPGGRASLFCCLLQQLACTCKSLNHDHVRKTSMVIISAITNIKRGLK